VQHDGMRDSRAILQHLRELYGENSWNAQFQLTTELYGTKMVEGSYVNDHVLNMINAIELLEALGIVQDAELSTGLIFHSIMPSFSCFITNFNMNRISATLADLLNMQREAEVNMYRGKAPVMMVGPPSQGKQQAVATPDTTARVAPAEESTSEPPAKGPCFHCGKLGHWKRNCVTFLKSIGKGMPNLSYIEVNMYIPNSSSCILDSVCGTHICSNLQALTDRRNLEKGEGDLQLADGSVVEAITV
ncbi:zf-CCHC domain-containing protein/UBN2_2 domain-containing protein, partial [Cephalotus follicularis]